MNSNSPSPRNTYITLSVLLSIVIHISLIVVLNKQISNSFLVSENTKELPKHKVDTPPPKVTFYEEKKQRQVKIPNKVSPSTSFSKQPLDISKIKITAQLPQQIKSSQIAQATLQQDSKALKQDLLTSLPPQIYEIKPEQVKTQLSQANISKEKQRFNKKDPFAQTSSRRWSSQTKGGSPNAVPTPELKLSIGTTRPSISLAPPSDPNLRGGSSSLTNNPQTPKITPQKVPSGKLDDVLSIHPFVYVDEERGQGYFQIDISLNKESTRLQSLNKEILFLLDTSTSISKKQLQSFTYAIDQSLKDLKASDRFNIVSFTTKNKYLFSNYVNASEANKKSARAFLQAARSRGKTDVYRSLRPFVQQTNKSNTPRIIYLATDGVTTTFRGYEGSEIIRHTTADNKDKTSIFTLSCGDDSDAFLLDLLTLRNQGYSLRRPQVEGADQLFKNFIKTHSDIVVSKLQYQFSGHIDTEEIFPKQLPHLYRGGTLSLYGKFDPKSKSSIVQIRGQGLERNEEITFKVDFSTAQKSSELLAKNWAHRKILALLGELTENPKDSSIKSQLQGLVIEHQIPVPYNLAE